MRSSKETLSLKENQVEIIVRNSGLVPIQMIEDYPDGNLGVAEQEKNVPFEIKRVYFITGFDHQEAVRGKHAHKELEQIIFCLNGSFDLTLDDGEKRQVLQMDNPYVGIKLGRLLWHEMTNFSKDCVVLVLASDFYDEADYIRDYQEFLTLVKKNV